MCWLVVVWNQKTSVWTAGRNRQSGTSDVGRHSRSKILPSCLLAPLRSTLGTQFALSRKPELALKTIWTVVALP